MNESVESSLVAEAVRQLLHNLKLDQADLYCLVTFEEVYALVQADLKAQQLPQIKPEHLAFRVVSHHLYQRCKDSNEELHNTAYQWLGQYLHRYIWSKTGKNLPLAEELVNDSLLTIYSELTQDKLRSPTSFLSWAKQIAHRTIASYYRKQARTKINIPFPTPSNDTLSLSTPSTVPSKRPYKAANKTDTQADNDNDGEADGEAEVETSIVKVQELLNYAPIEKDWVDETANPEKIIFSQEKRRLLVEGILNMKTTTKRAKDYQYILIATYFFDWSDTRIAQHLGLELKEVYKRRFQALELLRRDKAWFDDLRYD